MGWSHPRRAASYSGLAGAGRRARSARRTGGGIPSPAVFGEFASSLDLDLDAAGVSLEFACSGWWNASNPDTPLRSSEFATLTGISSVDFQGYGGGLWHSQLNFDLAGPGVSGQLTVEVTTSTSGCAARAQLGSR